MADAQVFLVGTTLLVVIILFILMASIRIVHEGEFMVLFRLGRAASVFGPGLAVVIPVTDRTIRVDVPTGMIDLGISKEVRRAARGSPSQEVPGHRGLTMSEVCLRAAMLARQRNPSTRKATVDHFQEALRELERRDMRNVW